MKCVLTVEETVYRQLTLSQETGIVSLRWEDLGSILRHGKHFILAATPRLVVRPTQSRTQQAAERDNTWSFYLCGPTPFTAW